VQVNIKNLVDDVQYYQTIRELRWPDGVACPSCESQHVIKRGCDDTEPARQRYECHDCDQRFDAIPQKSPCACSLERWPPLTQLIELRLGLSQGSALQAETLTMRSKALPFLRQFLRWGLAHGIE
jgi:DNA-directed RNA polymerase subunit RPC12/RpoP